MWPEALKNITEGSNGNIVYVDGFVDGMQKTPKRNDGIKLRYDFRQANRRIMKLIIR